MPSLSRAAVTSASATAAALALHAAVNRRLLRRPPPVSPARRPSISVLVPARDEATRIGPCVAAILASRDVDLEVLVLDDGSTDGTADVVRSTAAGDTRVRVLQGEPPPGGWLGKPHACAQLAAAAATQTLVFVDADVVIAPDGLSRTVALLDQVPLDLVSPYPRQETETVAERLVQPLLQWSWLTFLPLRLAERSPRPTLCAANGQVLACRRAGYDLAGGHGAVRANVVDDVALARAFKAAGLVATVADGTTIATCRMYRGWDELRDGYTKSLWSAFGSTAGALGVAAVLAWLYLLPPVAAIAALRHGRLRAAAVPVAGWLAGASGRVVTAQATGGRPADAAAHPLSVGLLLWLMLRSVAARRSGRLTWKGRPLAGAAR